MTRITADEARQLSGPKLNDILEPVYTKIREAASKKQHQIQLHGDLWTQGGYSTNQMWLAAKQQLESDGYKVSFYYNERQFVDMYTVVEW